MDGISPATAPSEYITIDGGRVENSDQPHWQVTVSAGRNRLRWTAVHTRMASAASLRKFNRRETSAEMMMMQKNRIEIAGVLAAKPITRLLTSDMRVANVRLAEDYFHLDKDGKLISLTNWHSLAFYDDLSSVATTYEKGENIFIEGRIEQRKFKPKDGRERTIHEVIVRSYHLIAPPRSRSLKAQQNVANT